MKNLSKLAFIFLFICLIISCSQNNQNVKNINSETPENLYALAMQDLEKENYEKAKVLFDEIEFNFPLSNEAIQSQIMTAFIEYAQMNYDEAIFKLNRIINRYPSHKNIDYAYYMKAICNFEQIENEYLDGSFNTEALESFNQVINRFPESKYARDSEQKIILIKENIAAKHMNIALFYLKQKKYLAAMNRYKKVIDDHSESKFTPEALHRLVEIYYSLGMIEDAKKTASVIGYNYPDSKWYRYSYELVGSDKDDKINDKSFFDKISNLLTREDEKK
jgi:outer membrane protein assembly factor BamD